MPKTEEIAPWATTPAATRGPYPRKNVYFIGADQRDVYDYLIWRANVRGYKMLTGEAARSSAEVIHDVLRRVFLRDMLDSDLAEEFARWRREHYDATGVPTDEPDISDLAGDTTRCGLGESPRLSAYLRARSRVSRPMRLAVWMRQAGKCAVCHAERRLKIYRDLSAHPDAILHDIVTPASPEIDIADLAAVCEPCCRRLPQRFVEVSRRVA